MKKWRTDPHLHDPHLQALGASPDFVAEALELHSMACGEADDPRRGEFVGFGFEVNWPEV
jgi:hypothetical protein